MPKPVKVARKIGVAIIGFPILLAGIAMLVLPGPGLLVVLLGLLIISWEFEWAKNYVEKVRTQLNKVSDITKKRGKPTDDTKPPK
ncbi:MAG: Protein of unknown function, transrane [Candidatus Saccharibacteria bacterium]|nr:Protein of unknown function, transrane [Candidatus Saccharibacteria bacterium]